jgi:hypothetical protein
MPGGQVLKSEVQLRADASSAVTKYNWARADVFIGACSEYINISLFRKIAAIKE